MVQLFGNQIQQYRTIDVTRQERSPVGSIGILNSPIRGLRVYGQNTGL